MPMPRLLLAALLGLAPLTVRAQDYQVAPLSEAPPEGLAAEVKAALADSGFRVTKDGKPFVDIWLRKAVPAAKAPAGPKGAILFPFLKEGEFLAAVRYHEEGYDYRDQAIVPGLYTLRYGLQPINGDHLGVSPYRDFGLLLPAKQDTKTAALDEKTLDRQSADAAGTNHPAVLMTTRAPEGAKAPAMKHDDQNALWGVVLPLPIQVGDGEPTAFPFQLILDGAAAI